MAVAVLPTLAMELVRVGITKLRIIITFSVKSNITCFSGDQM